MEKLNRSFVLRDFARRLAEAPQRLLMLDYDGTLAPFRTRRDEATPYPGVRERLRHLMAEPRNRVLVISGRSIDSLRPLLGVEPPPEIWGSHGIERLVEGEYRTADVAATLRQGVHAAVEWAAKYDREEIVERKPFGVAFHWRSMNDDEKEELRERVHCEWDTRAASYRMSLHEFDGGLELRASDLDKGHAVQQVLSDSPPGTVCAYLGDDRTDEDAFAQMTGPAALRVLVRSEPRHTLADIRLEPPGEMLELLDFWRDPTQSVPTWLHD